jgi:2-dehydro-3-deoxyphosphogluconate aldolase/(4S)-4-hydroxy-2-oxoglutarate aldolase
MDTLEKIKLAGIVPVVVIDKAEDAIPTANAMLEGGLGVMEITMRTSAGVKAIELISQNCKEMLVGAGTVLTLEKCRECVAAGAKFIVCPGFDEEIVQWCTENNVPVTPGCVTPSEIMKALKYGLKVLKFFPANVYGGLAGMKSLFAPFNMVSFIPTGGINLDNLQDFATQPFIHAIGGSWLCAKADIAAGNFEKITQTVRASLLKMLGFEMAHIGINSADDLEADETAKKFTEAFGFEYKPGNSSIFAGGGIEVNKGKGIGSMGHIAIRTNNIERAMFYLEKNGFAADLSTAKEKGGKMIAVYLKNEMGKFGIHLLQK